MMKHTGGVALGLGLFFAVPAMTFGGGLPDSIGTALEQTLSAIEVLSKLERDVTAGKPLPKNVAVQVTEAPIGDARTRDERQTALRDEVAKLRAEVDAKRFQKEPMLGTEVTPQPDTTAPVTPGLSESFLKALGTSQQGPLPASPSTTNAPAAGAAPQPQAKPSLTAPAASPEGKGYSANALRQAQACYRAGRYEQGLGLLESSQPGPTVDYWKAKTLERLGRVDEAILLFASVETNDDAPELRAAAKHDREFAVWRRDFEKKAGLGKSEGKGS